MSEIYEIYSSIEELIHLLEDDKDQLSISVKGEIKEEYCKLIDKEIDELRRVSNDWKWHEI